jgi:hypothetical protein
MHLVNALERMIDDDELQKRFAEHGKAVANGLDVNMMADRYLLSYGSGG